MEYKKPNIFVYRVAQFLSGCLARGIFKRKFLRNELKGVKGPAVVIANHQCSLDFVNLIGATKTPMHFVISNTFYNTLPIRRLMKSVGVIPKQQFQTSLLDVKAMKSVVDNGGILTLYPAGLMCEDGVSTPIPEATYRFIQFLHADVYVAKVVGSYFCLPKWAKKRRSGRTYMDIYKLASLEELKAMTADEFKAKAEAALTFDAYREQDELKIKYKGSNIEGLENVLYICPHCGREFAMKVEGGSRLVCSECGYAHESDEFSMLHKVSEVGEEIRYVSDFAKTVYEKEKKSVSQNKAFPISKSAKVQTIDYKKKKFVDVGAGTVTLTDDDIILKGVIGGEEREIKLHAHLYPSLPSKPGKYIELQDGETEYRLLLEDGKYAMKFINLIKILHARHEDMKSHGEHP